MNEIMFLRFGCWSFCSWCMAASMYYFYDVCVLDSDTKSYTHCNWVQFFHQMSTLQKKYSQVADASFTPFVVTAVEMFGHEAKAFMQLLADKFAAILHKWHSEVLDYVMQECFLLSFVLQIFAFVAVEWNGGGWRLKMELGFIHVRLIHWFVVLH